MWCYFCFVTGTGLALYLMDRMGRKILLILSALGMSVAMILLGISFSMNNPDEEAIIPCVSKIVAFIVKNVDAIIFLHVLLVI